MAKYIVTLTPSIIRYQQTVVKVDADGTFEAADGTARRNPEKRSNIQ
jgi:hypothetical protein